MAREVSTDQILGQEFLTWLWCKSDLSPASFSTAKGEQFSVSMEQRIVVQGGSGETKETASVSGAFSPLGEARYGLGMGKKVSRALLHFEKDDMGFQVIVRAEDLSFGSMKTPKVSTKGDDGEIDADAIFLEKMFLMEICVELMDSLYQSFLALRFSPEWQDAVHEIRAWLSPNPS